MICIYILLCDQKTANTDIFDIFGVCVYVFENGAPPIPMDWVIG